MAVPIQVVIVLASSLICVIRAQQCPIDKVNIPDENNCAKYFECSTGAPIPKSCPSGQYFNCVDQICTDSPWLTCCMNDPNAPDIINYNCTKEGFAVINPFYCGLYFICQNGEIQDGQCDYGQDFSSYSHSCYVTNTGDCAGTTTAASTTNTTPTSTTSGETTTNSPSSTTTTSATSTTSDITGSGTASATATTSTSPTSSISSSTSTTTPTNSTSTNTSTSTSPSTSTSTSTTSVTTSGSNTPGSMCSNNSLVYTNVYDCTKYYKCHKQRLVRKTCPSGQYWNCFKGECKPFGYSKCCPYASNPPKLVSDTCVRIGRKVPNPANCNSYFECDIIGTINVRTCPSSQKFDYTTNQCSATGNCVPVVGQGTATTAAPATCSEGAKTNNVNFCNMYYQCSGASVISKMCPFFQKYNCWSGTCQFSGTAHCCKTIAIWQSNKCETGKTIPDPWSCTSYYACQNNKSVKQYCDNGYVYDIWRNSCQPPTNGKCATNPSITVCQAYKSGLLAFGSVGLATVVQC